MIRLAISFLALALFATSGSTGGVAYLCLVDGQVRSECCCKKTVVRSDRGPAVRAGGCCEVRITKADDHPGRLQASRSAVEPIAPPAILPAASPVPRPPIEEAGLAPGVRGPPLASGCPLFALNCRYLI